MFDQLIGEKVKIVPMEKKHVQGLYEIAVEQDVWNHLPKNVQTINDMQSFVEKALEGKESKKEFPFVVLSHNKQIIGSTRFLNISNTNKSLEIGWTWYSPAVWGTNTNTECKYLLLKHCFETMNLIRIQFKTDEQNIRSQKAIEKLGAVKEGILRNHMVRANGTYRNSVYYSIIDSEWRAVKTRLEDILE
ncbi:GNAT family N-acetyltransferase [Gracilibacillus dipsosauri]|uniref:GNAT family N-acetyltransferase n=1 Tax=Gracilibacillus dipsosauri TaxID=178340 RepID=A0A317KVF0_9BACI|nr:GNAT family protein [Gracilibacillus dipsosauri]PWU67273.1 GNAT family N-acetyltransferase [Gracilibacillus dipsosauri]